MGKTFVNAGNTAIIDASSAILLQKVGLIDWCCRLVRLLMTRSVFAEVTVYRQPGADEFHLLAEKRQGISVVDGPDENCLNGFTNDIKRLHRGERDTLGLFLCGEFRFVIIDDGKAVRVCRRHGIPHVNALLLPRLLYFSNRLSDEQARAFFLRLCDLGRYTKQVVHWAETCVPSDLAEFL